MNKTKKELNEWIKSKKPHIKTLIFRPTPPEKYTGTVVLLRDTQNKGFLRIIKEDGFSYKLSDYGFNTEEVGNGLIRYGEIESAITLWVNRR